MSIKTNFEIPRGSDLQDVQKQGQRTAQDLSKNFKAIRKELDEIVKIQETQSQLKFIDLIFVLSTATSAIITKNHDLGSIPAGWYIIDSTVSAIEVFSIIRSSWTTSQISLYAAGINGVTVTCKIRVFV